MFIQQGNLRRIGAVAVTAALALSGSALADDQGDGGNPHGTPPGQAKQDQTQPATPAQPTKAPAEPAKPAKPAHPSHPAKPSHAAKPAHRAKPAAPSHRGAKPTHPANPQGHGPAGKTTICHATGSATNPYVTITISDNALPAHARHQDGRDIIPAPEGGCPKPQTTKTGQTAPADAPKTTICHATGSTTNPYVTLTLPAPAVAAHKRHQDGRDLIPAPEGGCPATAPAQDGTPAPTGTSGSETSRRATAPQPAAMLGTALTVTTPSGAVLGAFARGGTTASRPGTTASRGGVLAARENGTGTPAVASAHQLPFTGLDLALVVVAGLALLLTGVALRRTVVRGRTTA